MDMIKRSLFTIRHLSPFQKSFFILLALMQSILIFHNRPSQDDYGFLNSLTNSSFLDVAQDYWNGWGGNLSTVLVTSLFIKLALVTEIWIAYALFGFLSSLLIGWAAFAGLGLFKSLLASKDRLFAAFLFSMIGVSNLAFPAHVASLAFVTAAIAHLWPICIFVVLLWKLSVRRLNVFFLFFLGVLVSNANIVEGATVTLATFVFLCSKSQFLESSRFNVFPKMQSLFPLLLGQTLGILLILIAPGLSSRIDLVSSEAGSDVGLFPSFRSAFVAFTGAFLATPMVLSLFALIAALLTLRKIDYSKFYRIVKGAKVELLLLVSLFGMLVLGSTFAYASWHQSLGFVFLSSLIAFILIIKINRSARGINHKKIYISLTFFLSLVFIFDVSTGYLRGSRWDIALQNNACEIKMERTDALMSADMINPISKLGFEDIAMWEWMRKDYIRWLESTSKSYVCK